MTFDLSDFDALNEAQENGVEFDIPHPATGKPTGLVFIVAGPDSAHQREARRVLRRELNRGMPEYTDVKVPLSGKEREEARIRSLAAIVLGWRVKEGGQDVPFNRTNVERILAKFPFIADEIDVFASSRANYCKAPVDEPSPARDD